MFQGFLKGYRHLDNNIAFRTVIHVSVYLIYFGSRGTEKQIKEVITVGRDLIVHGWRKDKAWFADSTLSCLFTA
ncbi:hypothetical protein N7447_010905 [Penicillium robsamsonii]|uniref:uncharacterized protein n=1 Tax=Penicillium robsamsonii TaxID=1792511 RepID=UPI0025480ED1|nr:uncharacterized protein N7447_010905 [Penicillium robsamsonii]KAJ5807449.1 hypothetical protein N7447_010905 [Penicillium robsamsonii]